MVRWILSFPAGSGEGCATGRPLPRRSSSFRPCADVQGADRAGQPQPVGRADRVSDQGPAFVHALSRARVGRSGAGREHDLDVPRGADACPPERPGRDRGAVRGLRGSPDRAGFLAMGGQIVDASIIAAPKQRNTDAEKRDIKEGRIPAGWADKPAKLAQKDRDARWTVKWSKAKPA